MESNSKSIEFQSHFSKNSENVNPNTSSPGLKINRSPSITKSAKKALRSASKNPDPAAEKIRQRKFVVAKRNSKKENADSSRAETVVCKCERGGGKGQRCLCVAYESLRASHEEFFKNRRRIDEGESVLEEIEIRVGAKTNLEINEQENVIRDIDCVDSNGRKVKSENVVSKTNGMNDLECNAHKVFDEMGVKRNRDDLSEEAMENARRPENGRVMDLVKAFEKLLTIPRLDDSEGRDEKEVEDTKKGIEFESFGLSHSVVPDTDTKVSSTSFCPPDFFITSESLGLGSHRSLSLDSSQGRTSDGGRRSRRNSAESSGISTRRQQRRKQLRATSQKPFNLRTEQRGKFKEEEFVNKLKQMMEEDKKRRIPIAQGLPLTTDEPERIVKPPVKESTIPIDVVLHSDIRAEERAEFDYQVAEKLSFIEQLKMERDRLQKLEEEEEIRRLRKELVPKAQPLPYFDRPFIPKRSEKILTVPREPKFHIPQLKKMKSCDDVFVQ